MFKGALVLQNERGAILGWRRPLIYQENKMVSSGKSQALTALKKQRMRLASQNTYDDPT